MAIFKRHWVLIAAFLWAIQGLCGSVVSLDLCADHLLSEILAPHEFYAASYLSRDQDLSSHSDFFKNIPVHHGKIENFLSSDIKTVVAMDRMDPFLTAYFRKKGIRIIFIKSPSSVQALKNIWHRLGNFFNKQEKAKDLSKKLDMLCNQYKGAQKNYIFFGRQGISMGSNTLWTDVLNRINCHNSFQAKEGWFFLDLERLFLFPHSTLVLTDRDMVEIHHPIWQKEIKKKRSIVQLPISITMCPCLKNIMTLFQHSRMF